MGDKKSVNGSRIHSQKPTTQIDFFHFSNIKIG